MLHRLGLKSRNREQQSAIYEIHIDYDWCQRDLISKIIELWGTISSLQSTTAALQVRMEHAHKRVKGKQIYDDALLFSEMSDTKNNSNHSMRIVSLFRVLYHQACCGEVTTVRDIFYRDVQLYKKQGNLNQALSQISRCLDIQLESQCSIYPSKKGLIWGSLSMTIRIGNDDIALDAHKSPSLISFAPTNAILTCDPVPDVILIFEKDAIFQQFRSGYDFLKLNVISITGIGYPDRNSRALPKRFNESYPNVPIIAFVDSDVYGLQIFWQYARYFPDAPTNIRLAGAFILSTNTGRIPLRNREMGLMISFIKKLQGAQESNFFCHNYRLTHRELTRGMLLFKKAEMNVQMPSVRATLRLICQERLRLKTTQVTLRDSSRCSTDK